VQRYLELPDEEVLRGDIDSSFLITHKI